jgi:hypothetical protein
MRALILLECFVAIGLSIGILTHRDRAAGPVDRDTFSATHMLLDCLPGEEATYRVDDGRSTVTYRVDASDHGGLQGPPKMSIRRTRTEMGQVQADAVSYVHYPHRHGLFPFLTPEQPDAFDRIWVLRRIQRTTIQWLGAPLRCWRVECIDPALPADRETVLVWMHEDAPVFGVLRWERANEIYELSNWRPK